jgi:hypothetical protein
MDIMAKMQMIPTKVKKYDRRTVWANLIEMDYIGRRVAEGLK